MAEEVEFVSDEDVPEMKKRRAPQTGTVCYMGSFLFYMLKKYISASYMCFYHSILFGWLVKKSTVQNYSSVHKREI